MNLVSLKKFFELVTYPESQPMNEITRFVISPVRERAQKTEALPKETI